jgi:hypothetical protein
MENIEQKKDSNWSSEDVTFNGQKPQEQANKEEEKIDDSIIYSPEVISEHQLLFDNPWLKVKRAGGFVYSERKGVDSVAFVLIAINAADERRIGLIHEYKDPIKRFVTTAFGGSIDDEKYHSDLRILVKDEVIEESGFDVTFDCISYHGKVMVSTQSNQFCHLFSVEVDKLTQGDRTTNNPTELLSAVEWITMKDVPALEDWKAQAIILRRMMARNGLVFVSTPKKTPF